MTVYPRACGGTDDGEDVPWHLHGLSPRVRGNPPGHRVDPRVVGSIPARAGEPPTTSTTPTTSPVYPRACGGTGRQQPGHDHPGGLSPRVRGNPLPVVAEPAHVGSIPARAGEPRAKKGPNRPVKVYPRACGGTWGAMAGSHFDAGLSPRVRGNPMEQQVGVGCLRSIPARAGEPSAAPARAEWVKVYPRACGGTADRCIAVPLDEGLSPRVRGNHTWRKWQHLLHGSIPARAGEPGLR